MPYIADPNGYGKPILTPEEAALLAADPDAIPPPDTSMYAAPVEAQYQVGGANYVPPYDPGAQYGMGASGGDPAVTYAQNQPTDPYNTAPSGTYPSDPIPTPRATPASGSPYTSGSSALYGAGAVDTFNGGYPVTGGTRAMGFDPDPTVGPDAIPPPNPATAVSPGGGGYTSRSPNLDWADPRNLDRRTYEDTRRVLDFQRANAPQPTTNYNWDAAEPGPPKPVQDTSPVASPDMQPVADALGNAIPAVLDNFTSFFSPTLGLPGRGSRRGESARAAQDVIGGMILPDLEKPISAAGQVGRRVGQTVDPLIDRAAEGLVGGAVDIIRTGAGVPTPRTKTTAGKALEPSGGLRAMREQESIPVPQPSIPDRMGSWLQTEVVQPGTQLDPALVAAGDWLSKSVIDPLTTPRESTTASQREPTPTSAYPNMTAQVAGWLGRTTSDEWQALKDADYDAWAATVKPAVLEVNGVRQKVVESVDVPGMYLGYFDEAGNVVPVGGDVSSERFIELVKANAAEAPAGWGGSAAAADVPTPDDETATPATTLDAVAIPAPDQGSSGRGSSYNRGSSRTSGSGSYRSSGGGGGSYRSSGRGNGGFADDDGEAFTADDFMEAAKGDRRKAERMARMANKRRRNKSGGGMMGGFWDGFPFNRPPSPIREHVLTALQESRAAGSRR